MDRLERWERLLEELRAEFELREDELRFLHEIDLQLLQSVRPINATFDFIIGRTQELLRSTGTFISLRRGRLLELAYSMDKSVLGQRIPISRSLTGESVTLMRTINVADVAVPPFSDKYVPIDKYSGPALRSLLATPIMVRGIIVGVLSAESTDAGAFTEVHQRVIEAVAAQVAIALERVQIFDQGKLFSEVEEIIFAAGETQQVIPTVLQKVIDVLRDIEHVPITDAHILFGRGDDELEIAYCTNPSEVGLTVRVDNSVTGKAMKELRTIVLDDVSKEPTYRKIFGTSIGSEIAIPILLWNSDVAIGVLNVESSEPEAFAGFCQVILENFADKVQTLLAFAKLRSDVTEAMEVRNANDLLVAVGDQASNMIHRLNNTVGAMRLRIIELQDLERDGNLAGDPFVGESLAALRSLADQILEMPEEVTRLLNQHGARVNVNDVVNAELAKVAIPGNVALDVNLDPGVRSLSLFSFDIVVQNLIRNALDAMPNGGKLMVSTISVFDGEIGSGYVEFSVKDTGTGIAADVLPRVFALNFTTKTDKGQGHQGLGLWWIRNFVRRARGDVTVESTLGHGSEFTVKIPFDRPEPDHVAVHLAERHEEA
jgi:signal transduction histidine kinase